MKGFLYRTPTGVRAELHTPSGMVTILEGTPAERDGVKGYDVTTVLHVPDDLKIPGLDDADAEA